MAKAWQEVEFADYRERQIRRRARRGKNLKEAQARAEAAGTTSRWPLVLVMLLFLSAAGGIVWIRFLAPRMVPRDRLRVVLSEGEVYGVSDVKDWRLRGGERIEAGQRVRCAEDGKTTLSLFVADTRVTLFPGSLLSFKRLRISESGQEFQADFEVLRGDCVFEFRNPDGRGIVHVRTPQAVDFWAKAALFRLRVGDEASTLMVADGLVQASVAGKKQVVPADRQMRSTFDDPLSEPTGAAVIREVWK